MSCCNSFVNVQRITADVGGVCKTLLKIETTDPVTGAVTVTYSDPSTIPPTPVPGPITESQCTAGAATGGGGAATFNDRELTLLCDPTGASVVLQWDVSSSPPTLMSMLDLATGLPYAGSAGSLGVCEPGAAASLPVGIPVPMCDAGTPFVRWMFTLDGQPNGTVLDTDLAGQTYSPTGQVSLPPCGTGCEASTPQGVVNTWG